MIRRKTDRLFFSVLVWGYLVFSVSLFAQSSPAEPEQAASEMQAAELSTAADYRFRADALLMLDRAVVFLESGDWEQAGLIAAEGSRMSPDIADLWYVQALCAAARGDPAGDIIGLLSPVVKDAYGFSGSLQGIQRNALRWVRYNSGAARLMLAEYLTETLNYSAALDLIQDISTANSSNGQYIRARILYGQNRVDEARSLIRDAVTQYPYDSRFPLLFFRTELARRAEGSDASGIAPEVRGLADMLIGRLYLWKVDAPLTLLYGASFVSGREERLRLLKEYRASAVDAALMPGLSEKALSAPPHPLSSV
ncbi:MAG: tetratricopeptide repeat protein, partial [Spirochaetaceae bacterium]|nr:tetratricopeptide repeat protein [Spirochaetaceae bacterium]